MIIDITPFNYGKKEIDIDFNFTVSKDELKNTEIIDLKNVHVIGCLRNSLDFELSVNVVGIMILPCSRTLKPTEYKFDINIDEDINFKKNQKTIDIFPIIWENILMEIPIKVINPDAEDIKEKGNGWELITDDD